MTSEEQHQKVLAVTTKSDEMNHQQPQQNNKKQRVRLIWHRRDLRLHDNSLYSFDSDKSADTSLSCACLGLYVFNPRDYSPQPSTCAPLRWDAIRTGPHAARCLIEAVSDLRTNLLRIGGELVIRTGDPSVLVPQIARAIGATEVCWTEEPGTEEINMSRRVFEALCQVGGIKIVTEVGYPLYHPNDLPPNDAGVWQSLAHPKQKVGKKYKKKRTANNSGPNSNTDASWPEEYNMRQYSLVDVSSKRLGSMCLVMGDYRRAVRTYAKVRQTLESPSELSLPSAVVDNANFDVGGIPTIGQLYRPLLEFLDTSIGTNQNSILGLSSECIKTAISYANDRHNGDANDTTTTTGGETNALKRLSYFISSGRAAAADRALADVTTHDDSSRLSVHFAMGTLSPRKVYEEASAAGILWLCNHLEMRDFFIYYAFRSGSGLFRQEGAVPSYKKGKAQLVWKDPSAAGADCDAWSRWATGSTGFPLVDACMKELVKTGYCSNRVRQNAASFLTKDLHLDWRAGAELFQFLLDDYCVAANWGNWSYFSGVGTDPKQRHFRTISQALRYDPDGTYVRKWLQDLEHTDDKEMLFQPWLAHKESWPAPMVDPKTQFTWHDLERYEKTGKLVPCEELET